MSNSAAADIAFALPVNCKLFTSFPSPDQNLKATPHHQPIRPRERKIVLLIAQDLDNQHISNHLNISLRTVEKHRSNIVSKLKLEKKPSSLFVWARLNKDFI